MNMLRLRLRQLVSELLGDDDPRLKEDQTAYVLPLYYRLFGKRESEKMAAHLAKLVKKGGIQTGLPGTPYLLFALADNGQVETAFGTITLIGNWKKILSKSTSRSR